MSGLEQLVLEEGPAGKRNPEAVRREGHGDEGDGQDEQAAGHGGIVIQVSLIRPDFSR